jgi:hypothetical protein
MAISTPSLKKKKVPRVPILEKKITNVNFKESIVITSEFMN